MNEFSKVQVLSAKLEFFDQRFRVPMQLSSGLIEMITEARACVRVKVGHLEEEGRGSIYLSDLWAWPEPKLSHEERDVALRKQCEKLAMALPEIAGAPAHPLELGLRLHDFAASEQNSLPPLARALCSAPFDAAIHDAVGYATNRSAFALYDEVAPVPSADGYFQDGACQAISRVLRAPKNSLPGWWIINAHDDLDVELIEAIQKKGFSRFKIKLLGKDLDADAGRTDAVHRAALRRGVAAPRLSLDSNEAYGDADMTMQFLQRLQTTSPDAFAAVQYLEQPTSRDIQQHSFDWRNVTSLKPILLDEGLSSLHLLPLAEKQGWSGLALKTCKGHSFSLAAAAWAHERGMMLAMQDLTNPGIAAIHSWLFAAHLPVINGIELNSPQFTPQANQPWLPKLSGLFDVCGGRHVLNPNIPGLGSRI